MIIGHANSFALQSSATRGHEHALLIKQLGRDALDRVPSLADKQSSARRQSVWPRRASERGQHRKPFRRQHATGVSAI
jgi:hypothetical protein